MKPPLAPPRALPRVEVTISMRPATPQYSGVPRPVGPKKPVAWLSSTITSASYRSASAQISASGATSPSMEKTPSVAIRRVRAPLVSWRMRSRSGDVTMLVAVALGAAEPDAVDDGGMIEGVGDDRIAVAEKRLEETPVGVEARRVENGVLRAEEARDGRLELLVDALGAADEPHAGQAEAPSAPGPPERRESGPDRWPARGSCWRRSSAPRVRPRPPAPPAAPRGRARPSRVPHRGSRRARLEVGSSSLRTWLVSVGACAERPIASSGRTGA